MGTVRWLKTVIFLRDNWAIARISARGITRDLKLAKIKTNMAVLGLFRKTFFPPNLVNCLRSQILPSCDKVVVVSCVVPLRTLHIVKISSTRLHATAEAVCGRSTTHLIITSE